jgi:hypothetical protein
MAVMVPREKWTDERLDDLNAKVDRGFAETKAEMREGFAEMRERFVHLETRLEARVDGIEARFDRLQQTLIGSLVAVVVAIIGSNAF